MEQTFKAFDLTRQEHRTWVFLLRGGCSNHYTNALRQNTETVSCDRTKICRKLNLAGTNTRSWDWDRDANL